MNFIQHYIPAEIIEALGWTIIHSLWQASIVAFVLTIILVVFNRFSSQIRFLISFLAITIVLLWSGITFYQAFSYSKEKEILREQITNNPTKLKEIIKVLPDENVAIQAEKNTNINLVKIRSMFQRNFPLIFTLWTLGILFYLFKLTGGLFYTNRLKTRNIEPIDEHIFNTIQQYCEKLRINKKVVAFASLMVKSTQTFGHIKPVILFPITTLTGLHHKEIEAIIAHELAHIARNDYLFNFIQKLIEIIFFYHPAVWLIARYINTERENSCDDVAIVLTGDKLTYAKALYHSEENIQTQIAMSFLPEKGNLLQRIKRINTAKAMKTNVTESLIATLIVALGLTLLSFTFGNNLHVRQLPNRTNWEENQKEPQKRKSSKKDLQATIERRDSLIKSMEEQLAQKEKELQRKNEELAKALEVAMSENNIEASEEMLSQLEKAMEEVDLEAVIQEAMETAAEVQNNVDIQTIMEEATQSLQEIEQADIEKIEYETQKAMQEAMKAMQEINFEEMAIEMQKAMKEAEINNDEIKAEWEEALNEARKEMAQSEIEMKEAQYEMQKAMKEVKSELNGLNLDSIINAAMKEAQEDMEESIINDSLSAAEIAIMKSSLETASSVLEAMDMEALMEGVMGIVGTSLNITGEALKQMGNSMDNDTIDSIERK